MKRLRERFRRGTFGRAIQVLSPKDQRKVLAVLVLQVCVGILDLLGVIAIGLLGALSVTGLQSQLPGNQVSSVLNFLQLSNASFQNQALILGIGAVALLVGRTAVSIFFTRRILFFLATEVLRSRRI